MSHTARKIQTETGTVLVLDEENGTITRRPGIHRPLTDAEAARLPGDFSPLEVTSVELHGVGQPVTYTLATGEVRVSSPAVSIEG